MSDSLVTSRAARRTASLLLAGLLTLTLPAQDGTAPSDREITAAVERILLLDPFLDSHLVDAFTRDGIVSLSGTIDNLTGKRRCADLARRIRGVRSVVNRIEVQPLEVSDEKIREDVLGSLVADPVTDSFELDVSVEDGEVTLTGTVGSWAEHQLASRVAASVAGVVGVSEDIVVEYETDRPDAEIRAEVQRRLQADVWVDSDEVQVEVTDGVVDLSGSVSSAAARERALTLASVAGVKRVEFLDLAVDPDGENLKPEPRIWQPHEIETAVGDALVNDPRVAAFKIDIDVDSGVVTLEGTVDNLLARRAAVQDTRNTCGVWRVVDRIKVRTDREYGDEEIAEAVRSALGRNHFTNGEDIEVLVRNRKVHLDGLVETKAARYEAGQVAAATKGVVAVANHLRTSQLEPGFVTMDDRALREDIEQDLWWNPYVDSDEVEVQVVAGVATLTGRVTTWFERTMAVQTAELAGAETVIDNLSVVVDPDHQ